MLDDLFTLVQTILQNGRIGTLTLSRSKGSERIFFDREGAYIFGKKRTRKVAVTAGLESIPSLREQIARILSEALTTDRTLPEIIESRGWMLEDRAIEELAIAQAREEILSALAACQSYFRFRDGDVPEELLAGKDGRPPACVPRDELLVALEARRRESEEIERSIPILDEVFMHAAQPPSVLARGFIGAYIEASTLKLVDGHRTVRDILAASPFFETVVLRSLVSLLACGAIKKTRLPEIAGIQVHKLTPAKAREVLPLFRRVVRHAWNEMEVRLALAQILDIAGQPEKAVEEYCALGDAVAREERWDEALALFEKALELAPRAEALAARVRNACLASARSAASKKDFVLAEQMLRRAIALFPDDLEPYLRLVEAVGATRNARKLAEIADEAAARTRASGDPRFGLTILDAIARIFPHDPDWRIRRANLLLDIDRREEAIQELFRIAAALREKGDARRSAIILGKLERLAEGRDDVIRAIRECRRTCAPKRGRRRWTIPLPIAASAILLLAVGYQAASYFAFCRIERRSAVADAAQAPSKAQQADGDVREAEAAILRYRNFRSRWPYSVWAITAGGRIAAATERERRAAELRDEIRAASYRRAEKLRELGDLDGARQAFAEMVREGISDPWHDKALGALDGILSGEAQAEALAAQAKEAELGGRFEDAFRAARKALDDHPASPCVRGLALPVEVVTDPPGARIWVGGVEKGPAPQVIRVHPMQPIELTATLPGYQPARRTIENPQAFRMSIPLDRAAAWRLDIAGAGRPPLIRGESIYATDASGGVHAVDSAVGTVRWAFREGAITEVRAGPIAAGVDLCIATNDGRIAVIDGTNGTRKASIPVGGLVASELVPIAGGRGAAVATRDGKVRAFDLKRGAALWQVPAAIAAPEAIASVEGQVALAVGPSSVLFLEEETGRELWRHELGSRPVGKPIAAGGLLVWACEDGRVHALDPRGRRSVWSADAGAAPGPFLPVEEAIWFLGRDGAPGALALLDGRTLAQPPLPARPRWIAPGPDGSVLVDAGAGRFLAVDPATGRTRWRFAGEGIFAAPPVVQGDLVIASSDRGIFGIHVPREEAPTRAPDG